ncbi:MAG: type II toxin-antitoxin system MqsA family antitoxin [Desulfotignum sp.]|nr:type II toxin-antitoxin system MqsA family antitoxin [Desulfotignum sp.]MCF8089752.1 type II toxin-antitoxin system MqsA family antitoxin [Desulfotignum sp.]
MKFEACPVCGSKNIEMQITSEIFEYKGHHKTIDGCEKFVCKNCEESFFTDETSKRNEKIVRDFHREVDGLLTSAEMLKIRTSLGFTQKAFGELLGGGPKAFAKYESCVLTQSKAMDNLIRIVDSIPGAIEFLKDHEFTKNASFKTISFVYLKAVRPAVQKSDYNVTHPNLKSQFDMASCEDLEDKFSYLGAS